MTDWTIDQVKDRLEIAAEVMRQTPGVKPRGYFNAWQEYFHSFADKVGQKPRMRRPLSSLRMITEADEAMLWLRWLERWMMRNSYGSGPNAPRGSRSAGSLASRANMPTSAGSPSLPPIELCHYNLYYNDTAKKHRSCPV